MTGSRSSISKPIPPTIWTPSLQSTISEGWFAGRKRFALFCYIPAGYNVIKAGMKDPRNEVASVELKLWLLGTLPGLRPWFAEHNCRHVTAMPGHKPAGPDQTANEEVCELIARECPEIKFVPRALVRVKEVPSYWRGQGKPTAVDHINSLRYAGPKLKLGSAMLVFDDQHTSGDTSLGASIVLKRAGLGMLGLYLTRSHAPIQPNPIIRRAASLT